MIPKIAFTFWEGLDFSYLHALTIITFSKFNPEFKIIIYYSQDKSELIRWNTGEHSQKYKQLYDIYELEKIANVEIIVVDIYQLLNYNKQKLSGVWKSDIIRIVKLCDHGGMYIDFDILFIKKIPDALFESNKIMWNTYSGVINNAIIISNKENVCLQLIKDKMYEQLNHLNNEYMQFGATLITPLIKNTVYEEHVFYLPNDCTCPYLWNETHTLFFTNIDQTTTNTFAVHWYNGSKHSREYGHQFQIETISENNCMFEKLLYNSIYTKYDFIEIGTAYFDTEIQKHDGRVGLSIDLIQEYLDRLPDVPNVTKICCAISDKFDEYIVYKPNFPPEFPEWLSGCISVLSQHKHVINYCNEVGIDYNDYMTTRFVKAIPVSELIKQYNIGSVDYLKIDTEGHDTRILNNWLDCCIKNKKLYPKRIFFESKDLTSKEELDSINKRLLSLNYKLTFYEYDTEAVLQE
jgi:hypothetical protein